MQHYQHILVAVDLSPESKKIIQKATEVASNTATITVLHIMPSIESTFGVMPYGGPVLISSKEFTEKIMDTKNTALAEMLNEFDAKESKRLSGLIRVGKPAKAIKDFAEENLCDLIVLGTHGQEGMRLLLGSTANAVLHGAPCDVLSVRCYR